jgi:hypothetical protein
MINLSNDMANAVYFVANIILIVGAILTLAGTIGVIWSGSLRDKFSDERASDNERKTADANAKAALANERAVILEKQAADARLELEKLKEKNVFRQITPQQEEEFVRLMKGAPQGRLQIVSEHRIPEIAMYAGQIKEMLAKAGISSVGQFVTVLMGTKGDATGIAVAVKNIKNPPPHAVAIQSALEQIGIQCKWEQDDTSPDDYCRVIVGRKESQ